MGKWWGGRDLICEDVDLEVRLDDCHFDIEGCDLVSQTLQLVSQEWRVLDGRTDVTEAFDSPS